MGVDIKIIATSAGILSKESLSICLLNCSIELKSFIPEFTSNIDVSSLGSHGESDNEGTLDKLVRIMSQNFSIFASSWLGLISIDYQVRRPVNYKLSIFDRLILLTFRRRPWA